MCECRTVFGSDSSRHRSHNPPGHSHPPAMPLPRGASAQHCRLTLWTLVAALCALYCLSGVVWAVAASPTAHGDGEIAGSDGDLPHAGQDGDNSTTSDSMPLCSSLPSPPAIGACSSAPCRQRLISLIYVCGVEVVQALTSALRTAALLRR